MGRSLTKHTTNTMAPTKTKHTSTWCGHWGHSRTASPPPHWASTRLSVYCFPPFLRAMKMSTILASVPGHRHAPALPSAVQGTSSRGVGSWKRRTANGNEIISLNKLSQVKYKYLPVISKNTVINKNVNTFQK